MYDSGGNQCFLFVICPACTERSLVVLDWVRTELNFCGSLLLAQKSVCCCSKSFWRGLIQHRHDRKYWRFWTSVIFFQAYLERERVNKCHCPFLLKSTWVLIQTTVRTCLFTAEAYVLEFSTLLFLFWSLNHYVSWELVSGRSEYRAVSSPTHRYKINPNCFTTLMLTPIWTQQKPSFPHMAWSH